MNKIVISVLIVFTIFGLISMVGFVFAEMPQKVFGFDKIMNFSDGYAYFDKISIGDPLTPLDLNVSLQIVGDANITGDLNISGNASIFGNLNVTGIQLKSNCADGQILKWSGGIGTCGTDNSGGGGSGTQIIGFSSGANDMTSDNLFFGIAKGDSSEAEVQINFPFDITVTGIHCNQGLAGGSDRASFTLRDDGADTTITCTTTAGAPTCSQTGQSVDIDMGSLIAIAYQEVATATAGHASCIITHTGD